MPNSKSKQKYAAIPHFVIALRGDLPEPNKKTPAPKDLPPLLSANALYVYALIADVAPDKRGFRTVTRAQMVERSGIHLTLLPAAIRALVDAKLVETFVTNEKLKQSDNYRLKTPSIGDGWVRVPREWVQNKKIKPAQFATLVYLLGHRNAKTKVCRPSVATLA